MKNIYIIRTPLQLLNALEAKHHFPAETNILIVNAREGQVNKSQIDTFLSKEEWDEVIWVDRFMGNSVFLQSVRIIRRFKKERIDRIFIGFFRGFKKIFISNVHADEIYLLDDGAATTLEYQKRMPQLMQETFALKERLRYGFFGLSTQVKRMPDWFTTYSIEPHNGQKIVQNSYEYLRETYLNQCQWDDDHVYLIGMELSKKGFIREATYFEAIEKAIRHFDKKIVYIPHRYEKEGSLKDLREGFGDDLEIRQLGMAVEIYFLKNRIYPAQVVSFFSSALFNLEKIYEKSEIYALFLPEEKLLTMKEEISDCYREMQRYTQINFLN